MGRACWPGPSLHFQSLRARRSLDWQLTSRDTAWAMSEENVEFAKRWIAAWNAGDMYTVWESLDPDVILRPAKEWPEPGPFIGRDAVWGFYDRTREAFDADTVETTGAFSHAADRVVIRWVWHGQGHGPEANMELTTIFTVRNGKIREAEYFWDHAEALEAAGLSK